MPAKIRIVVMYVTKEIHDHKMENRNMTIKGIYSITWR